ncbi:MAG: HK97 family phage prohead protease [Tsuneonella sp.]
MNSQTLPFQIKSVTDSGVVEGVISAFGQVDRIGDTIEPGAYSKSIKRLEQDGRKLPLLYQHDPHRPIGVWTELSERSDALFGRAELAMEVRDAQEAHALARKGALTGISIGYEIAPGGSRKDGNRRILSDIDLWEASLVTFPCDTHARVTAVKDFACARDIAELLQAAGLSGRRAKVAAGAAWKAMNEAEADEDEVRAILNASAARIAAIGA